jgi:peptide/nickel transport system substrate-binding protein
MWRPPLFLIAVAVLLVACGGGSGSGTRNAPAGGATAGPGAAAATTAAPRGELRVALGIHFPGTLDATKDGFTLTFLGAAETLMRLNRDQKVEPWLAQGLTQVDPTTWRVTLRRNATFWDGSPVTAEEVAASLRRSWETQPAANIFIPKETQLTVVDAATLEFKTPRPVGGFPNALAAFQFVIAKPGANGSTMTGPYRPVKFETDKELVLEAYTGHWGGPPPVARITVRLLPDANARVLALQAGDVDMLFGLPPEIVKGLPADIERAVIPSTRIHYVIFNHTRPLFAERAVREAFALGVDRAALNRIALDNLGAVAANLFPPNAGIEVVPAQSTDVNRARQVLEEAGWRMGPDGVRVKDGRRLSFTLYSYPGRAELTPMAVVIQSQLKPLGFDIQLQQVQNITATLNSPDWDAAMYSINSVPTGDPLYLFTVTLSKSGGTNPGGYSSPALEAVIDQLRTEVDATRRQALARQAQEIVKADVPNAYLVGAPLVYAYKKGKVAGFTPHPNDLYFIDPAITVK